MITSRRSGSRAHELVSTGTFAPFHALGLTVFSSIGTASLGPSTYQERRLDNLDDDARDYILFFDQLVECLLLTQLLLPVDLYDCCLSPQTGLHEPVLREGISLHLRLLHFALVGTYCAKVILNFVTTIAAVTDAFGIETITR